MGFSGVATREDDLMAGSVCEQHLQRAIVHSTAIVCSEGGTTMPCFFGSFGSVRTGTRVKHRKCNSILLE